MLNGRGDRSGTVLIVTMWVVLVLAGLALVFTHAMRVELRASANSRASRCADAAARGAIELARAIAAGDADAVNACEAAAVGNAYVWLIMPDFEDDRKPAYGLIDLAGRVNINTAPLEMLLKLPGMTSELAASIVDWRDPDDDVTPGGAENEYYLLLDEPYQCKNAPFESVEELLLVKGATHAILFGEDTNRNNMLDDNENDADLSLPHDDSNGRLERGLLPYITVHSRERLEPPDGKQMVNINESPSRSGLNSLLREVITTDRYFQVMDRVRSGRPYANLLDFYVRAGLTRDEFDAIVGQLSTTNDEEIAGRVNINTAPEAVLACLPSLDAADASALAAHRGDGDTGLDTIAWVLDILPEEKAVAIGGDITTSSYHYAADIVAIDSTGRGYARRRVVIDLLDGSPRVVVQTDLTRLGWPLDRSIMESLRGGGTIDAALREASQ